ncbi:MAG: putative FmdB family regulatory protein, partial [Cocleimonas sp.]
MPVYDYKCSDHGLFYELASMDNHAKPAFCPTCQILSPRVIIMAPSLFEM